MHLILRVLMLLHGLIAPLPPYAIRWAAKLPTLKQLERPKIMGQVQVTIDGKQYRMACDNGQEKHLECLAAKLDGKMAEMKLAFGEIGDMRLSVMSAITIADELFEANERLAHMEKEIARLSAKNPNSTADIDDSEVKAQEKAQEQASAKELVIAQTILSLAERVERIAKAM
jgi:cell division protein ZapA